MSKRKYTHIKLFEKEILEMKDAGKTKREIAEALGLEKEHKPIGCASSSESIRQGHTGSSNY